MTAPPPERRRRKYGERLNITPAAAVVALGALLIAGLAARDAVVPFLADRSPALAVQLAPRDATSTVNLFNQSMDSPDAEQRDIEGWAQAMRQALRADPLNASAIRMLAYLSGQEQDDLPRVQRLMLLSEQVSRRDPVAQMWLIEDAVRAADIEGALRHYDRALTTRPALAGQLVPVLAFALREPLVRQAIVPYVRADRPWIEPMLSTAIDRVRDPAPVLALFREYGGARTVPAHEELEARLLDRLVRVGRIEEAGAYAATIGAEIEEFAITEATSEERFQPLTWSLYQGADGAVALNPDGSVTISVDSNTRIVAATRVMPLSPGSYTLRQTLSYDETASSPLITWTAYCRSDGGSRQFWTRTLPNLPEAQRIDAPFAVPSGCAGVQIDLAVTGADGVGESAVTIDNLTLDSR